jgi:hypothetical protein
MEMIRSIVTVLDLRSLIPFKRRLVIEEGVLRAITLLKRTSSAAIGVALDEGGPVQLHLRTKHHPLLV